MTLTSSMNYVSRSLKEFYTKEKQILLPKMKNHLVRKLICQPKEIFSNCIRYLTGKHYTKGHLDILVDGASNKVVEKIAKT